MRVLFVINCFSYGGAEKLVFDLARGLAGSCDYVGVAALYRANNDAEKRMQQRLAEVSVKTYILDKKAGADKMATVLKLRRIMKQENVTVLHAHCSVPMYLGKIAGKLSGVKVVCTVHNTRGYRPMLEKTTGWMVDAYVSIGQAAEDYMAGPLGIPRDRITRIYNAVDAKTFQPGAVTPGFWKQWGVPEDVPVAVNVGRIVPQKNQICMLRALERCRKSGSRIHGVILGDYDEHSQTFRDLRQFLSDHDMEECVHILGQQDDVQQFLRNSSCFVMTSHFEGLSLSFLEAVLCGVPVITTDMPFVRELEQIAPCAVVVPQDDADALSERLLGGHYAPPSEDAMEIFRRTFSLERFCQSHLALYHRCAQGIRRKS